MFIFTNVYSYVVLDYQFEQVILYIIRVSSIVYQSLHLYTNCTSFEEQKGTRYIPEKVYFGIIIFSCLSPTKFILNCFVREIKIFYQSSLRTEANFRDIMNVSPNILAKN